MEFPHDGGVHQIDELSLSSAVLNTMSIEAVVFDFDGVLVESVDVKTRAFVELYRPFGEAMVVKVVAYHLAHGGVSRREKFRYFHREILCCELSPAEEDRLAEKFSALVEDEVVAADSVAGATAFLAAHENRIGLYVASGTPEEELRRIVVRRGMSSAFRGVYGAPATKGDILRRICGEAGLAPRQVLMVGDAMTDYVGACEVGVNFLGRVANGQANAFPDGVPVIADLTDLARWLDAC